MGFNITIKEGLVRITQDQRLLEKFKIHGWRDVVTSALEDADYVEPTVNRHTPFLPHALVNRPETEGEGSPKHYPVVTEHPKEASGEENIADSDEEELPIRQMRLDPSEVDREIGADEYWLGAGWNSYKKTTHDQLHEGFSAAKASWVKSHECEALIAQLETLKHRVKSTVTNVVALGIGSLHTVAPEGAEQRPSLQLAALLTIRNTLSEAGSTLPCMVQDPAYSELEKEFLRSLDLNPVDDPDGFSGIDAGSLVFNVGTYLAMAWWMSVGTWPAAMVTNDWGNAGEAFTEQVPSFCCRRVRDMYQDYEHEPFIEIDHDNGDWGRVDLYWRK